MTEKRSFKEIKKEIIDKFKIKESDTGSSVVQVALLTERINRLSQHLESHKKDHHSRRGLIQMVNKRRKHLKYLFKYDNKNYLKLLKELKLRGGFVK